MNLYGFWGKTLHVDLTDSKIWVEEIDKEVFAKLVGGRAMIAHYLLKETEAGCDPLGPGNIMIFSTGPFQGTILPGAGRHAIGAKSPLTNGIASAEAGGYWGHSFKRCGYDHLVIHGSSDKPAYIYIDESKTEIRSAENIWGKDPVKVEELIREESGSDRVRIAQCGLAGEKKVLFSTVMHDVNRAAGRGGLGAVMGSKNLKAVAVSGTKKVPVFDESALKEEAKEWIGSYKDKAGWLLNCGTSNSVEAQNAVSGLPTRNFRDSSFADADKISGDMFKENLTIKRHTCQNCPVKCKQISSYTAGTVVAGKSADFDISPKYGGPEYETIAALGSCCMVGDMLHVAKANELACRYGLDTISMGVTLAFVMECVEKGLLTDELGEGFLPEWGDGEALLKAITLTANREGFGDKMALGSKRLASIIGGDSEDFLVEVKGQEAAMHDPRTKFGHGLGMAVCPTGADHMINVHDWFFSQDWGVGDLKQFFPVEPVEVNDLGEMKIKIVYHEVNKQHFFDCGVLCMFFSFTYQQLSDNFKTVTGIECSPKEILRMGERAQNLARMYNLREGLTYKDDRVPKRLMTAFKDGPIAGQAPDSELMTKAVKRWYALMGWSLEGVPGRERLIELGLSQYPMI